MPRRIDHEERRRQLARALWRVLTGSGLEAVSLRQVAAEAGVSMGMVLFALSSMTEQVGARMGVALAELPDEPLRRVRAVLVEMLPLDEERRIEAQVATTFLAHAPVDPRIAEYLRSGYGQGHAYLTEQLRAAGVTDAEREASLLFAVTDGLTVHTLAGHCEPAEALAVLESHLTRLAERLG